MNKELTKKIDEIKNSIEVLMSEFEEKFDNASESWQNGERGEQCMSNIAACQEALDALDNIE